MPLEIVRNDITKMQVDAIVNAANETFLGGGGVDGCIHRAAGPKLLEECRTLRGCKTGSAKITKGYDLPAKYVIHTVGPIWRGGSHGEEALLRSCYERSLLLAKEYQCKSVAFPLISAGVYGYPKAQAMQVALQTISAFLMEHEMTVYMVVFNRDAFHLSEKLFQKVRSYIDEHYVQQLEMLECRRVYAAAMPTMAECAAAPKSKKSLREMLQKTDAGFSETLLKLIDKSGKKDSAIYNRANVSRQHFSKIRNNPNYKPTKATAVAFAMALELDLEQTQDLIGRAGYALTNSSKFDVIIKYFIEQGNYNMMEINTTLFEFDQVTLGV